MAQSIGSLAYIISASPARLVADLAEAKSRIAGFASSVGGLLSSAVGGAFGGTAFGGIGGGGLTAGIADGFKLMKGAIFAGLGGAPEFVQDMTDKLNELYPVILKARTLGVAVDEFQGLTENMKRFGLEAGDVYTLLAKFSAKSAGRTFLGIDPAVLQAADPIGKLRLMADAVAKLPDPAQQAAAAFEAFGKKGAMALQALAQGGKGMDEWVARVRAMGSGLTEAEADQLIRAKQALPKLAMIFDGFKTRVLVAFAPLLEFFAGWLGEAQGPLVNFFKEAAVALQTYFVFMINVWDEIRKGIGLATEALADFFKETLGVQFGMEGTAETTKKVLKVIGVGLAAVFDTIALQLAKLIDLVSTKVGGGSRTWDKVANAWKLPVAFFAGIEDMISGEGKNKKFLDSISTLFDAQIPDKKVTSATDAVRGWGDAAANVAAWFDQINWNANKAGDAVKNKALEMRSALLDATPAAVFGSQPDYEIRQRFTVAGMTDALSVQEKQLEKLKEQLQEQKLLRKAVDRLWDKEPVDFKVV